MITTTNVVKKFDNFIALDNIDLKLNNGQVFGLIGSNGSGKSTLLRLLSGVYTPDSGEILIDDDLVFDNKKIKERVFFLSDTPFFFTNSSVNEMAKFYKKMYNNFSYERLEELSKVFPIDKNAKISSMSKGMMRQAALMLAFSCCPDYLFLDEAFDGLDPVMRESLKRLITKDIVDKNITVIITSHNLRELENMCDRVGLLHKGKIVFDDNLENLKSSVHKIQAAFKSIPSQEDFNGLNLLKFERTGSIVQVVVKGNKTEILDYVNKLNPIFVEAIQPTLEELFIFELGGLGYDISEIIE